MHGNLKRVKANVIFKQARQNEKDYQLLDLQPELLQPSFAAEHKQQQHPRLINYQCFSLQLQCLHLSSMMLYHMVKLLFCGCNFSTLL